MINEQLEAMAKGDKRPPKVPSGAKEQLKVLAKRLMAANYRNLPEPIKRAERGVSVTLSR